MFNLCPPPLYFSILCLLFHTSFIRPVSLPSSFCISFSPLLSPLSSFRYIHSTCARLFLSPHSTFCTFFPLISSNICFLVFTSESCHHFSLSCTLSPQVLRDFLCHTPFILPVVPLFVDSLPSFLLVRVFVPFTQLFIHPSCFCSHLSTSSLAYPFLW
jgi:hypothetical protein